jgi:hypothetical protein
VCPYAEVQSTTKIPIHVETTGKSRGSKEAKRSTYALEGAEESTRKEKGRGLGVF